jgi:hypothetical integral membrane protein (TIGR02206 family)
MPAGFETFSVQHFSALFVFGIVTVVAIRKGNAADEPLKTNIGLIMAGLTFSSLLIEGMVKWAENRYDVLTDLPFFLCDLVAILLPFVLLTNNRKWIGILYFWALAGTIQALITPELEYGFPSFDFFRYFITHAGIVVAVLYTVVVWKINISWKDLLNAVLYAQVYLVMIHMVNQILGSNYSYTMQKPQSASALDLLGAWPWYILWGEVLMVVLFLLLLLPFLKFRPKRQSELSSREGRFEGD